MIKNLWENDIEYFRQIGFEQIIKKYCDNLLYISKKSKRLSKEDKKLINKALKSVVTVKNKWFYRKIDENTIRYFPMKGKKLLLDVTNTDGEKTYLLQYQKQQSMAEECYKIEKSILTRNPKETKTTVFTRVSTK